MNYRGCDVCGYYRAYYIGRDVQLCERCFDDEYVEYEQGESDE